LSHDALFVDRMHARCNVERRGLDRDLTRSRAANSLAHIRVRVPRPNVKTHGPPLAPCRGSSQRKGQERPPESWPGNPRRHSRREPRLVPSRDGTHPHRKGAGTVSSVRQRRTFAVAITLLVIPGVVHGCAKPTAPPPPPGGGTSVQLDFAAYQQDVAPVLAQKGCDAGGDCHGAGIRGSLELSPQGAKD